MGKKETVLKAEDFEWHGGINEGDTVTGIRKDIVRHLVSSLGSDYARSGAWNHYQALALTVRDRLVDQWFKTQRSYYDKSAKRVYYLSLEYLPGKALINNLHCLGLYDEAAQAVEDLGFSLEELAEIEVDAGLGNGGLGRLASCYMDSMAALNISGYGYGIRYDYGIFHQMIENGWQVEKSDNWMRAGNPWEFERGQYLYEIKFFGQVHQWKDDQGRLRHSWVNTNNVLAMACDMLVPGFGNNAVINMRLWAARSDLEFRLDFFNTGDYIGAVQEKVRDETISKVLYPSDHVAQGRELRLMQQYFFVAATLKDIIRRYVKYHDTFDQLPDKVAIQLNDTHPAIAIPELMRILVDEEFLPWDKAWDICTRTFAYTNHTILPEALETWPCDLIERVLPRHMQIIYEINHRFLEWAEIHSPKGADRNARRRRLSIIQEGEPKRVRMANLSIVGSHSVNGVSAMHSEILVERVFKDFHELYPTKINNKTNGVTPRRWVMQCNPALRGLLKKQIGEEWILDLDQLRKIEPLADDAKFRKKWREMRLQNKKELAAHVKKIMGMDLNLETMFDVHIKRIHEYKRQLMNVLHVITLYNRILDNPEAEIVPRTVFFAGKAASGYHMAKLIIKLINCVADTVNADPKVGGRLMALFLPNYRVSQAELLIPATDLSEQISMSGMEASGTGNMKFALNGALTIGTMDGANVEMSEEIGEENMFIFGHDADGIQNLKAGGYDPVSYVREDSELCRALDMIRSGAFSPSSPDLFKPLTDSLLCWGDQYCVLADYRSYVDKQQEAANLYLDQEEWTRRSILNTARMGKFSSDRSIAEYARDIWGVEIGAPTL